MSKKPVVLVVMDGVGLSRNVVGNAVVQAHAETLKGLINTRPMTVLGASGGYVGIPDGDMGNSEVGHNAMGAGQIILQGPRKVQGMIESGEIWSTKTWGELVGNIREHGSTLHFIGIFSDGNIHSNITQLFEMMRQAQKDGVTRIRIHAAFDGRDVAPESADRYIEMFEEFVVTLGSPDYKIADGGGRMVIWCDRYENDWGMVEKGWKMAFRGEGRKFDNAAEAIATLRAEEKPSSDQFLSPFVITENDEPIGTIKKGDSVVFFNFRADRAIEAAMAFTYEDFPYFDRGDYRPSDVYFAGMAEYNSDTHVPEHVLTPPVEVNNSLSEFLAEKSIPTYAISETVKYGHITYYFDGNHYFDPTSPLHTYVDIPSETDTEKIASRPWMKAAEITDALIEAIRSGNYEFLRVNFPNGDMVGHFGNMEASIVSVEAVDLQLKRILEAIDETGGTAIITADHGNVEETLDKAGKPKTAHTTNRVPCIFYNLPDRYSLVDGDFGLANLASTIAILLDQEPLREWLPSLISPKY